MRNVPDHYFSKFSGLPFLIHQVLSPQHCGYLGYEGFSFVVIIIFVAIFIHFVFQFE